MTMAAMAFVSRSSAGQTCGNPPEFGKVWTEGKAVLFKASRLNVDADGAPNSYLVGKRPATPSPPGSPNSVFVSTPNDVDTNTLQFLLNSASAYACPAVGQ